MKNFQLEINNEKIVGIIENEDSENLIILVHGFTGNLEGPENSIFRLISDELIANDFAIMRFSFRGTPPSDGEFQSMTLSSEIDDLRKIIDYAKELDYKSIGLIGESMGGTVISNFTKEKLSFLVFWYPVFNFLESSFKDFLSPEKTNELDENGFVLNDGFKIGRNFIEEIKSIDTFNQLRNAICPTLFIHGKNDKDVPYTQSVKAFGLATRLDKEIELTEGADHCYFGFENVLIERTIRFIKKYA